MGGTFHCKEANTTKTKALNPILNIAIKDVLQENNSLQDKYVLTQSYINLSYQLHPSCVVDICLEL